MNFFLGLNRTVVFLAALVTEVSFSLEKELIVFENEVGQKVMPFLKTSLSRGIINFRLPLPKLISLKNINLQVDERDNRNLKPACCFVYLMAFFFLILEGVFFSPSLFFAISFVNNIVRLFDICLRGLYSYKKKEGRFWFVFLQYSCALFFFSPSLGGGGPRTGTKNQTTVWLRFGVYVWYGF